MPRVVQQVSTLGSEYRKKDGTMHHLQNLTGSDVFFSGESVNDPEGCHERYPGIPIFSRENMGKWR